MSTLFLILTAVMLVLLFACAVVPFVHETRTRRRALQLPTKSVHEHREALYRQSYAARHRAREQMAEGGSLREFRQHS